MKPTEIGRLCGSCQKTVVDFTAMSDAEVMRFMAQQTGNACGRFRADQLNRPLRTYSSVSHRQRRLLSLLTAGLFGWHTTQAQISGREIGDNQTTVQMVESEITEPSTPGTSASAVPVDSSGVITGRVVARADNADLSGVTVRVEGTYVYVYTYATGTFQLTVPVELAANDVTLSVSCSGYVPQEISVKPGHRGPLLIALTEETNANIMGEVMVTEIDKKPSFLDRLRNRLLNNR